MAYIEENLKVRSKPRDQKEAGKDTRRPDPQDELYRISDRWKVDKKEADEGNVTNSLTMLTAIPEVDLGIECVMNFFDVEKVGVAHMQSSHSGSTRLKNIEETEKAKRVVAEERQERKKTNNDEEHLAASRCASK